MKWRFEICRALGCLLVVAGMFLSTPALGRDDRFSTCMDRAQAAGVSAFTTSRILALGLQYRVEPSLVGDFLCILGGVTEEGVPDEPFLGKIEEGFAKKVPPERIKQVLQERLDRYVAVREALERYFHHPKRTLPPEKARYMVRVAESLYMGLTMDDLNALLAIGGKSLPALTRGVEALASLRQVRFNPSASHEIVITGLRATYFDAPPVGDFVRAVETARSAGITDEIVAKETLALMAGRSAFDRFCSNLGVSLGELGRHGPQMGRGLGKGSGMGQGRTGPSTGNDRGMGMGMGHGGRGGGGGPGGGSDGGPGGGSGGGSGGGGGGR